MKQKNKIIRTILFMVLAVMVAISWEKAGTLPDGFGGLKETSGVASEKTVVKAATKKKKKETYNQKARKAYKKFLKDYYVNGKAFSDNYGTKYKWRDYRSDDREYTIRDINHDGKLELLIYNIGRPEEYLFTYYKGKVKCLAAPGYHYGFVECKKGKLVVICGANCGTGNEWLYLIQNGKLKPVGSVDIENEYTGSGRMKNGKPINEWKFYNGSRKEISKAKFKKILKKYTGSTDVKAFCVFCEQKKTQLKAIKYKKYKMPVVKPVKGIKVSHALNYHYEKNDYSPTGKSEHLDDNCKVTWNKSVKGNVQITYADNKKFKDKKTKIVKASEKKNYCLLKELYGCTYYIKVRAYIGDKSAYSKYSKVYKITTTDYGNVKKYGDNIYYSYEKKGKYYVAKRNLKTNKETKIITSNNSLRFDCVEGKYMYYEEDKKNKVGNLYAYNMDTKEKRFMMNEVYEIVEIVSGKVFCEQDYYSADFEKYDLYSFDMDGTNKKLVVEDTYFAFVYNNQIYWYEIDWDDWEDIHIILRRCNLNGTNKEDVTEWMYSEDPFDEDFSKKYAIEHYIDD